MADFPINTDIKAIPYADRYKTDEDGCRWVLLEEAKSEMKNLSLENAHMRLQLHDIVLIITQVREVTP